MMADKLQGTWTFRKDIAKKSSSGSTSKSWSLRFISGGQEFSTLVIEGKIDELYTLADTPRLYYGGESSFTPITMGLWTSGASAYRSIEILSSYDEVKDAENLVKALSLRADFVPSTIHVPLTSSKGVRLKTQGKQCDRDVIVTPELETLTVTESGVYTPSKVGYSQVSVMIPSALPYITSMEIEGGADLIADYSFKHCASLRAVTFLGKPKEMGADAFADCYSLTDIYVPWAEGEVANAPWGATNATIHYNS